MSYRFLEEVAIADVAIEAQGRTLDELFSSAGLALTNSMVKDVKTVVQTFVRNLKLQAETVEMLLYHFLQELVYYKDAELLLFSGYDLRIRQEADKWVLTGAVRGEELSQEKHELVADVKAVSLHNFKVSKIARGWMARMILDV